MRIRGYNTILFLLILSLTIPAVALAADLSLERDFQKNLRQSKVLLSKIEAAMASGGSYSTDLAQLKTIGESIRSSHQALLERFKTRETQVNTLGAIAASRHTAMQEHYEQAIAQYLSYLDDLSDTQVALDEILQLKGILEEILPKKKRRIHGSVPYRHLNLPAQAPKSVPEIIPAYKGGDKTVTDADLAGSPEAPISLEIAQLAESLNWNPVEMYEWVKNNVETEWYWGCMKGAEETLKQKSGNDADQAALLVALFRAADFPARYVRGVIEFFPDIETAKNQTGIRNERELVAFFQKAGIPLETVIAGGRINNIRLEHIWAEVEIPYDNYRGAMIDEHGKTWLALDTSIKAAGYTMNAPADVLKNMDLSEIRDSYLADLKAETPMEYLKNDINSKLVQISPGTVYEDLLLTRTINPEHMKIIPASLQFKQVAITGEYTGLPNELIHKAKFIAAKPDGTPFFDQTLPVYRLSNKSIAVTFEPETIEDQEVMHVYGGLDNTPFYLIHLRPILTVDGNREILGQGGLSAGADFDLTVELIAPATSERMKNMLVSGYPAVIGIAAQQAVVSEAIPLEAKNAERLLYEQAMSYINQGNKTEDELAALFQMNIVRPLPTVVTLGGVLDVVYLLDSPHGYEWKGVYLDADQRVVETAGGASFVIPGDPESLFMNLSSLQDSSLENRVFENSFGVESISTAKLLALANEGGLALATIDATNIDTELPALNLPETIAEDIANAVNQGYVITIPEAEMFHEDWSGYGYIKENPGTGESGWMLSGEIAGGMTALNPDQWPSDYADIMANPMVSPSNNPLSAIEIKVIKGVGILAGTAGQQLNTPLQVIALDREGKRVRGVVISFEVKAGGSKIRDHQLSAGAWQTNVTTTTGFDGIAEIDLLFGQSTNINPATAKRPGNAAVQKVDETVIEVSTASGLQTAAPISVYAFPDAPHHLRVEGGNTTDSILSWGATLIAYVEDQYGNSINNQDVDFVMGSAQLKSVCSSSNNDNRPGLLVSASDPCMNTIPVHGECGTGTVSDITGLHIGAVAHVILGGLPDAVYHITVESGTLPDVIVDVSSNPVGVCDDENAPYRALALKVLHASDSLGNIINGGQIGTTIPFYARLYSVREKGTIVQRDIVCEPSGTDSCPVNIGTGEFYTDTNFVTASVKFNGISAVHEENGLFRVNYPLGPNAIRHEVTVTGEATETVKVTIDVCDENNTCDIIDYDQPSPLVSHITQVYAVDITIPQDKHYIPVDEDGNVTYDHPIDYTIEPQEYTASTAYFAMSKEVSPDVFENVSYINSKTSGSDQVTLLRGFRFNHDTPYKAQVVLNEGSDYMEVNSKEIILIPLTIELDADMNRDGNFTEDDPREGIAPGLVIPLNIDDDDGDGVPDDIDGFDSDGISGNEDDTIEDSGGNQVEDDDLSELQLSGLPATLNEGTVVLEVIQGADKVRIWTNKDKGAGNILIDFAANGSAQQQWTLGPNNDLADLSSLTRLLYIEGIKESSASGDTAILVTKYISPEGVEVEMDRLVVTVFMIEIVPDYNRDGKIDELDRGKVNDQEPWRIWINDDNDAAADAAGLDSDNLPGQNTDIEDYSIDYPGFTQVTRVNGIADLIDFFPLYIDLNNALVSWPIEEGYKYILKQNDEALDVFEAEADGKILSMENVIEYLEDLDVADAFKDERVFTLGTAGFELSPNFLERIKADKKYGVLLVEGRAESTEPLDIEIVDKDGNVQITYSFPLEIVPVTEMYGHKNLRHIAGGIEQVTNFDRLPIKQPYCMNETDKTLLWVHGYNVTEEAAEATFAEVFKRFFHAGYNGQFWGVSWYGNPRGHFANISATFVPHYHQAVINAIATADSLTNFVKTIPGEVSIAAHSLGNMLVGESVHKEFEQDNQLSFIKKYFAINAAVALEAYGDVSDPDNLVNSNDPNAAMIKVEDWPDYIVAGGSKLLASEWHELFTTPGDNRKLLTWRNRLGGVQGDKIYNFYSSTDEVLRGYEGDHLYWDEAGLDMGRYTWVKQEKHKGRRDKVKIASGEEGLFSQLYGSYIWLLGQAGIDIGGASSNYCGWSFSSHWKFLGMKKSPEDAATISDDDLKVNPFFALDVTSLFDPSSFVEPSLDNLVQEINGITPSQFVIQKINETDLTNYYTYNLPAHDKVLVKDWLLAEAFPATTLPMGANENGIFDAQKNINMSGDSSKPDTDCCRTDGSKWPNDRNGEWHHSDYKDVPYQHVYEFYKRIKKEIDN